jgi:hypothetical protein
MSGVLDTETKKLFFYTFYISGSGKTYYDIEKAKEEFRGFFKVGAASRFYSSGKDIIINDYKQHIIGFGLNNDSTVYDVPIPQIPKRLEAKEMRAAILSILKAMLKIKPKGWHKLRADASLVYAHLQKKGTLFGYTKMSPIWSIDTYSGRSRATEFAIQGLSAGDPIANPNGDPIFIHFDWVSADIRAAAIMSQDQKLNEAFEDSNPYDYFASHINRHVSDDKLTRAEAKEALLASIYRMDMDGPVMEFYTGLKCWIRDSLKSLRDTGYAESIVGRKFRTGHRAGEERSERSAFNATIQGSVASAMQATIHRAYKLFPDNILCETHDSLIITSHSDAKDIKHKIETIAKIMTHPFNGVLESDPAFPLVVSVGKEFGNWRPVKRFNG